MEYNINLKEKILDEGDKEINKKNSIANKTTKAKLENLNIINPEPKRSDSSILKTRRSNISISKNKNMKIKFSFKSEEDNSIENSVLKSSNKPRNTVNLSNKNTLESMNKINTNNKDSSLYNKYSGYNSSSNLRNNTFNFKMNNGIKEVDDDKDSKSSSISKSSSTDSSKSKCNNIKTNNDILFLYPQNRS